MGLFDEPVDDAAHGQYPGPSSDAEAADLDLGTRLEQFLNRWHWRGDRAVVRRELEDLIELRGGKRESAA